MFSDKRIRYLIIILILAVGAYWGYQQYVIQQNEARYSDGFAAYSEGNCEEAMDSFAAMTIVDEERGGSIEKYTSGCDIFLRAEQAKSEGDYVAAFVSYLEIMEAYQDGDGIRLYYSLDRLSKIRIKELIVEQGASIATGETCDPDWFYRLDSLFNPTKTDFVFACGKWHTENVLNSEGEERQDSLQLVMRSFGILRGGAEDNSELKQQATDAIVDAIILWSSQGHYDYNFTTRVENEPEIWYQVAYELVYHSENITIQQYFMVIKILQDILQSEPPPSYIDEARTIYADAIYQLAQAAQDDMDSLSSHSQKVIIIDGLFDILLNYPQTEAYPEAEKLLVPFLEADARFHAQREVFTDFLMDVITTITTRINQIERLPNGDSEMFDETKSLYAEAMANYLDQLEETQDIPSLAEPPSFTISSEKAIIYIQNDSPHLLQFYFRSINSAFNATVETLEACATCEIYTGTGPDFCPEELPTIEIEMEPGEYQVIVSSQSSSSVTPFRGIWNLETEQGYSQCFFIVTQE